MANLPPVEFWSAAEKARYMTGYTFGRNADVSAYATDDYFMLGHNDELYGNPPIISIANGSSSVGPVEFWTDAQKYQYQAGFTQYPDSLNLPANPDERLYYVKGYDDAVAGRVPILAMPANTGIVPPNRRGPIRVAPPVYQPQSGLDLVAKGPFLEAYAYIDVPFFSKGIAFDTAVKLDTLESSGTVVMLLQEAVKFTLLGLDPGDDRRGFKLSGPTGPIAAAVRQFISLGNPNDPRAYGLPYWVGARTRKGVKLFGARTLKKIVFE